MLSVHRQSAGSGSLDVRFLHKTTPTGTVDLRYAFAVVQSIHHRFNWEDYLRLEADSGLEHEFLAGQVWGMAGSSPEHGTARESLGATRRHVEPT